jgi:hypothetical protein
MATKKPKKGAGAKRPPVKVSAKKAPARKAAAPGKPSRPAASKPAPKPVGVSAPAPSEPAAPPRNPDERRHVLSLSFVRDGDEFMARIETDNDQIIELKNRSLDQLLTLVASELEDLLE